MVEAQLAKCILILEKYLPGFRLTDIDTILDREGIVIPPNPTPMDGDATTLNPALGAILQANSAALVGPAVGGASAVKVEPIVPSLSSNSVSGQATSAAGGHQRRSEGASDGSSTVYEGRQTNGTNHASVSTQPQSQQQQQPSGGANGNAIRGQDPMSNNLSSADGLIKAFGVSRSIVRELPKPGKLLCFFSFLHVESGFPGFPCTFRSLSGCGPSSYPAVSWIFSPSRMGI